MRRLTTTVLGLAALALSAVPAAAGTDAPATATRPTGNDRYETAAKLATEAYEGATPETVLIASGEKFPDGLAASYLTGVLDAPILLVRPDLPIPQPTLDAIDALGSTKAIIAGGPDTVSEAVEDKLVEELGDGNVDRVAGDDRIETATLLATEGAGDVGTMVDQSGDTTDQLRTAIVADEGNFPDALAVGALAFHGKYPLLLTKTEELSDLTKFTLEDDTLDIEQVIIAGGPNSVSTDVEAEIDGLANIQNVHRVAGSGRTETAADIASLAQATQGWDGTTTTLTTGENFPDALALAPLAARMDASILLTANKQSVGGATFASLQSVCTQATNLVVASGPDWVPDAVVQQALMATECSDETINLAPENETGGGQPGASGRAWFWYDTFCYAYTTEGLTSAVTGAHIHEAPANEDGAVVASLDPGTFVIGCVEDEDVNTDNTDATTADELKQQIQDDPTAFYVNVHTEEYPSGAVRGQFS